MYSIQLSEFNKAGAIRAGFEARLQRDPEIVNQAYELYAPALNSDLSVNLVGLQFMLDEDKRSGLIDSKFTLDRVINDKLLKLAQQELRTEGRLK